MRFEFVNAQRTCELSRKAFVRMLSGALEISEDYTTWNSVDEDYPDKYKTLIKPYFAYRKQSYLDWEGKRR